MNKLLKQIAGFGIVGIAAFIIDYTTLMALSVLLGVDPVISAGISFVVSTVFNYFASMRFVFTHRDDYSRGKEFVLFCILSIVGLIINEMCMWMLLRVFGTTPIMITLSKVITTTIVMVWNFVSRKHWLDSE